MYAQNHHKQIWILRNALFPFGCTALKRKACEKRVKRKIAANVTFI